MNVSTIMMTYSPWGSRESWFGAHRRSESNMGNWEISAPQWSFPLWSTANRRTGSWLGTQGRDQAWRIN